MSGTHMSGVCPKCREVDAIFVPSPSVCVTFDGKPHFYPAKLEAWCNNSECDQRFWWFWRKEQVTKRNTGRKDWRRSFI